MQNEVNELLPIQDRLIAMKDDGYKAFHSKLIPTVAPERILGVRTPGLRQYAKELMRSKEPEVIKQRENFLQELPHRYYDEDQLHAFLICLEKDISNCFQRLEAFLPYINNWATCDQLSPKIFVHHLKELDEKVSVWMKSEHTYTVRYAIGMRMQHFLGTEFCLEQAEEIAAIRTKEYYINMMIAWYFATALAKQYEQILPFLTENKLDNWVHNKTIQKAIESNRITDEQKRYLRTLKQSNKGE